MRLYLYLLTNKIGLLAGKLFKIEKLRGKECDNVFIPLLWGKPIQVWLGILLLFLLFFQVLTGKRVIKLPFVYHRYNAMVISVIVLIHAFLGLGLWFWGFKIGQ